VGRVAWRHRAIYDSNLTTDTNERIMSDSALDERQGRLVIGIDLGTTKSGVAVWDDDAGQPRMLADEDHDDIIPSVVAWDQDANDWLVGKAAKAVLETRPWDVAYSVKRFIGRPFSDRAVAAGRSAVTYGLARGGGDDLLRDVRVRFGQDGGATQTLDVPQISAKVLARLRQTAAKALGLPLEDVTDAVITVPAYFDMRQRMATQLAGQDAGLKVRAILHEPTAAALAHGNELLSEDERRILVYDLGGGTFDISLLEVSRDAQGYQFFTILIDGNTQLGGDDIDAAIARWFETEIERVSGEVVRADDVRTRARLRLAAERAKQALTREVTTKVVLDDLELGSRPPFSVTVELTREAMEACAMPTIAKAREITQRAVQTFADLEWDEIDEVVLVGGPTQMPVIQRDVAAFTGKTPRVSDRPQTAIALGAAVYAHMLSLGAAKFEQNTLTNTIALALGVRLADGSFKKIVNANATVPHQSPEIPVTTTRDDQTEIVVEILQGRQDAARADDCVSLGAIRMEVPPAPAGQNRYGVRFEVESNGIMTVTVTDPRRNRSTPPLTIGDKALLVYRQTTTT
jgi:molecular chaperone DnaK